MVRKGIAHTEIYRACFELAENGESVTVDKVRAITGGSNNTLAPLVRSWKTDHPNGIVVKETEVPQFVLHATKLIYDRLVALAEVRAITAEESLIDARLEAQSAIAASEKQVTELMSDNASLSERLFLIQKENDTQKGTITAQEIKLTLTSERLQIKKEEVERFVIQAQIAHRQREHFENASTDRAREMHNEIVNLERDSILIEMELKSAQANIAELKMMLAHANQDNEELKVEISSLKDNLKI